MNLRQVGIAFGKYINGDRPGCEGWSIEDDEVFKWVIEGGKSAMCEANSNAVLADVRALLKLWPKLKKTDMWGNEADWEVVDEFEKQIQKVSAHFS